MRAAGIITEYNPLHEGHVRLFREIRKLLGEDTAIVCCMSGDFVQRGEPAVARRQARAKAAVLSGADLVLELPLPWAVSSAEGFAQGAVSILNAAGVVDYLVFGSESGNTSAILNTAELLLDQLFPPLLREELSRGDSFPAARQRAAVRLAQLRRGERTAVQRSTEQGVELGYAEQTAELRDAEQPAERQSAKQAAEPRNTVWQAAEERERTAAVPAVQSGGIHVPGGETDSDSFSAPGAFPAPSVADILSRPNDALAVEYCKALLQSRSTIRPIAIRREGSPHDAPLAPGTYPSASAVRELLRGGETDAALSSMAPAMAAAFREEQTAGRAPVFAAAAERAALARLRSMSREDFAALDSGREGVGQRLWRAVREASSLREILDAAKTRRYPMARLRRMILWACLGLAPCRTDAASVLQPLDGGSMHCPSAAPPVRESSAPDTASRDDFVPMSLWPDRPSYLRPLAASAAGQRLLARMRSAAALPILNRPKDVKKMGPAACSLFQLEARGADLYALAYPDLAAARGGSLWREGMPPPLSRA